MKTAAQLKMHKTCDEVELWIKKMNLLENIFGSPFDKISEKIKKYANTAQEASKKTKELSNKNIEVIPTKNIPTRVLITFFKGVISVENLMHLFSTNAPKQKPTNNPYPLIKSCSAFLKNINGKNRIEVIKYIRNFF